MQYANYPDKEIQLGDHHTISAECGPVKINVKTAMLWLTELADFCKILDSDRFIKKHWSLIEQLAETPGVVRLHDRAAAVSCIY